jgi:hypothetical protein
MTHDSRTLSAVFMAVVLILASGTAVSLAVTDSSSSDAETNAAAVQEETTTEEDGVETTDEDGVETTQADEEQAASVTINEQESDGETVVIESVTMDEGGFVAIHDSSVQDAPLASVLGNSVYLEPGTHENVEVTLARPLEEGQTIIAMPHYDTNDNQVYDFVLSTGQVDGPYTADGGAVVDSAEVSLEAQDTTTTQEEVVETTTTEEEDVVEETTTEEDELEETTTEEDELEETTTEEDELEETTTEEDELEETTTEEDVVEETTTTEEEEVVETTTEEEEEVVETTTEEEEEVVEEEPTDEQQVIFKVEQMNIDEWSFVVGDEEEPDRTEVISNIDVQDRRVEINLTEQLQRQQQMAGQQTVTTVPSEQAQEQLEEELQDIETVRFVIRNVNLENVTFVVTAPEGMELPEPPMTTTTEEEEVETTTTEEEEVVETTTEEEEVETTTEEEVETTTEEEEIVETTTTEEEEVETTTEEEEEVELDSFNVSGLDAPERATVGDTITVSANVTNPNDQQATQDVAFRLDGTVIERQSVTLDADEERTVTFEIDTSDVPPGVYVHGVYTRDFGELAVVTLDRPSEEEETETPADEETTTVEVETTTEEA